jgi:hypothetical protein
MMAHELLRKAAEILAAGWIKNADAGDDAGRILPLWSGAVRAEINPQATRFSPYGAICKARSLSRGPGLSQTAWNALNDLAKQRVVAQQPLRAINELEDVTQAELDWRGPHATSSIYWGRPLKKGQGSNR